VQALVTRGEAFALVYVELLGVRKLMKEHGAESRDKAIRHLARAINTCGVDFEDSSFYPAHMGGGFFVVVVPCDSVETFCNTLSRTWRKHLPRLFEAISLKETAPKGPSEFLDAMICATSSVCDGNLSPKELMDTLTRIRRSVRDSVGGVHLDRRMPASDTA
jgi:GGDEF domain-containing protein